MPFSSGACRKILSLALLTVSVSTPVLVGAFVVASHTPFELQPETVESLAMTSKLPVGSWRTVHLLAADCACSRRVALHLIARGAMAGVREEVTMIGLSPTVVSGLCHAGFKVRTIPFEDASQELHISGVPWFIVFGPDTRVRYAGGYTPRRGSRAEINDVGIWQNLVRGKPEPPLPAYGCAVGDRLRRRIDPFGWKYPFSKEFSDE